MSEKRFSFKNPEIDRRRKKKLQVASLVALFFTCIGILSVFNGSDIDYVVSVIIFTWIAAWFMMRGIYENYFPTWERLDVGDDWFEIEMSAGEKKFKKEEMLNRSVSNKPDSDGSKKIISFSGKGKDYSIEIDVMEPNAQELLRWFEA